MSADKEKAPRREQKNYTEEIIPQRGDFVNGYRRTRA